MIPRNVFLPKVNDRPAIFTLPENDTENNLEDKAWGGVALNNSTKGRKFQLWDAYYEDNQIKIKPENVNESVFSLPAPGALHLSLAFDNNMAPVIAWQTATGSNLYHYQTLTNTFGTKVFLGTSSCKVELDNPNDSYSSQSDVVFVFVRDNSLYFAIQRERYETERLIGTTLGKILRAGLTEKNRFQIECG